MLNVDWLQRLVLADRQALLTAALMSGVDDIKLPTIEDRLAEFDAALAARPEPETANRKALRLLGVA